MTPFEWTRFWWFLFVLSFQCAKNYPALNSSLCALSLTPLCFTRACTSRSNCAFLTSISSSRRKKVVIGRVSIRTSINLRRFLFCLLDKKEVVIATHPFALPQAAHHSRLQRHPVQKCAVCFLSSREGGLDATSAQGHRLGRWMVRLASAQQNSPHGRKMFLLFE